jgi:GNAT superfamily N-acetyltransferase
MRPQHSGFSLAPGNPSDHAQTAGGDGRPPTGPISIRTATRADVPLILTFIRELAEYEKALDQVVATHANLDEDLFGPKPACEALIGEINTVPCGFALFFHNYSTWVGRRGIYLEDLFVRPEARGHGLGEALLRRVARIAVDRGCQRLEWNVLDWNTGARAFYERLGATPMSEWTIHRVSHSMLARLAQDPHRP